MDVNANSQLDQWADMVRGMPLGKQIKAPWSGVMLEDRHQAAAVALIKHGVIGASVVFGKKGEKLRLYLGRDRVRNPFFRLLGGWTFCALMVLWLASALYLASMRTGWADHTGLVISAVALIYFGTHGLAHYRWAELFQSFGRLGEQTKLGSCAFGAALAFGAVFEFFGRVF